MAIKELGEYIRESKNLDDVQILTESSKLANTKKMICVVFKTENDRLVFDGVHIEDFDYEKARKILYRSFRHGRYNAFLTSILTQRKIRGTEETIKNEFEKIKEKYPNINEISVKNTDINRIKEIINAILTVENLKNKWDLWFNQYLDKFSNNDGSSLIKLLKNEIDKRGKEILWEIIKKYDELGKEDRPNCVITIKIKEGGNEKYPAEVQEFLEVFRKASIEDLYSKHGIIAKGRGICAFCGKEDEVMPASPFAVFTVKKIGFAYDFNRQNSWKQLPICEKCALDLQVGKEWIMDKERLNLSFTLYGYQYFVIPNFVFKEVSEEIITEIEFRKSEDYRDGLLNAEEDILEIIKERKDVLNLIFIFYEPKQQFFDIIRYVEEVPPSWIKKVYDTFRSVTRKNLFKEEQLKTILGEKWSGDFIKGMRDGKAVSKLNLAGMIGDFFYRMEKKRKSFDKSSLNILGDILEAKQIDKMYFIKHLIEAIREEHEKGNEWNEKLLSLKSLYLLDFLFGLDLISLDHFRVEKFREVKLMEETKVKDSKMVENFFSEFSRAFDTPDKKAVFLEGILVSFLLDIQYAKRKDTPFRKKLHGLKLNRRLIKRLFPEIIEKLRQYDAGYPWLETLISKYFVEADESGWVISDDEISYYFALGLNLGRIFKGSGGDGNE